MIHTDRRETLLFYKKENLFLYCTSVCVFIPKRAKKITVLEDVHWVSMYRNVYNVRLWRTSWFCFSAFSFLRPSLLLSSDVPLTHRPAFHLVLLPLLLSFCWARGLCILSKCAVCKSVQLRVSFCFVLVLLLHRTCWTTLREVQRNRKQRPGCGTGLRRSVLIGHTQKEKERDSSWCC